MVNNLEQGFFGIGIQNGKTPENLGVLWRSAQNLGASYIFTIGNRYAKQACDTHKAVGAMPYFHYETFDDFYKKGSTIQDQDDFVSGSVFINLDIDI